MALTGPRATPEIEGVFRVFGVSADAVIHQGALIALLAGYAEPGSAATGLVAVGRAEESVDATGLANGVAKVKVRRGIFKWKNKADDLLTIADVGATAYVVDDETVCKTATGKSAAGKVIQVDSDGVWVETL
jgi:hypothetical protein